MANIGPTFGDEVAADPILKARPEGVIWDAVTAYLPGNPTPQEQAALTALLAAHNPAKQPVKVKRIKDVFDALTDAESDQLTTKLKPKQLWSFLTKGNDQIRQDDPKIVALCTALGITPAALFSR